jgi:hypothetical protein
MGGPRPQPANIRGTGSIRGRGGGGLQQQALALQQQGVVAHHQQMMRGGRGSALPQGSGGMFRGGPLTARGRGGRGGPMGGGAMGLRMASPQGALSAGVGGPNRMMINQQSGKKILLKPTETSGGLPTR